jgi:MoaA/NifB/PqqE/SkfB family radical SAM enzyme
MTKRSKELELVMSQLSEWAELGIKRLAGRREESPIRELHIELTHRCDLKCVMCHHWELPWKDEGSVGREMTPAQIERFISESSRLRDVRFVAVTGGEPWMRPEAADIIALLSKGFPEASLGVLTNLWNTELLRRKLTELDRRGVPRLWLGSSLDRLGETHDRIRGQKGAFAGLERTLDMLRREFPEVGVSVNFTITPENRGDLWGVYSFAKERSLGFGSQFVVNHEGFEAPKTFRWTDSELDEVEEQIDLILEDLCVRHKALERLVTRPPAESQWLWSQLLFWHYLRRHGRGSPRFFDDCQAGRRFAMLDPEGNLFFCPVNKHKTVGNVAREPFDAVWEGQRACGLREEVIPCQCRCWLNCIANPILDRVLTAALVEEAVPAAARA